LLGEIVCSGVPTPTAGPLPDPFHLCDDCSDCISACPTGAIVAPGIVDSRRCLSFHSIENTDDSVPGEIASSMALVFGCDTCTKVCPHDQTDLPSGLEPPPRPGPQDLDMAAIPQLDEQALTAMLTGTALFRTGPKTVQRNARYILAAKNQTR
jgi:epoxyqueuosine reductase